MEEQILMQHWVTLQEQTFHIAHLGYWKGDLLTQVVFKRRWS